MGQYLPILALGVLAILFAAGSVFASAFLNPRRPTSAKIAPYECGIVPTREPPDRFPVSFYLVAMLFIMFDIEIIFLYPYAVSRGFLGAYGFWEMIAFSVVFFMAFVYVVAKGALDWGPISKARQLPEAVSALRTSTSTVRRVGLEGRIDGHTTDDTRKTDDPAAA
jgi:NADH-quinone oxidoreductase subunit A